MIIMIILIIIVFIIVIITYYMLEKINNMFIFMPTIATYNELDLLCNNNYCKKETFFTPDDILLHGILINKKKEPSWNDNIFLYSHGNAGWIGNLINSDIINELSNYGSIFIYDYRGYGITTNTPPSENNCYLDIIGAWNFISKKTNKIIVYGHSLGTTISSYLITYLIDNNIDLPKVLILEAPMTSIKDVAKQYVPEIITNLVVCKMNNIEHLTKINNKIPIYIFHSELDEIIPYQHALNLKKYTECQLITIYGTHNAPILTKQAKKKLKNL